MTSVLPTPESLSLAQQVAQLVIVRASGHLFDHQIQYPIWEPPAAVLQHWVKDLGIGGVIFLGGSAAELAMRTQQLQDWSKIPLLTCADVEEGVGQRFAGATWFPPPMAIAAIAQSDLPTACHYAEQMGKATAEESLAIGLNWVLGPIVDVNNNPNNPVINVRAFGETTDIVIALTTAFIKGAQQAKVLTCAKHFPGHGDTAIDSHLELPVIPHDRDRLEKIELPSFKAAIAAHVDSVMSAHLQIPALDPDLPATLSPKVLTEELRQRLGFEGLIVTDALIMGAIANRYGTEESAVLAIEAGADLLMMPPEPEKAIQAVCAAVESGRIALERILASVERVLNAKAKICETPTETYSLTEMLAKPDVQAINVEILKRSIQVYKPTPSRLSTPAKETRNLIIVDDIVDCDFLGRTAPAIAIPKSFGFEEIQIVDRYTPKLEPNSQPTLLQLFIRGNPFRGSAGLTQLAQDWFEYLCQADQLQALVIYGSPYVVEQFVPKLPKDVPYVFSYGQMQTAQAIALNQLFT
jgi:beta-glucosidase